MKARIGVIGTGWWATQFHLPGLLPYEPADVVALADRDPDRLHAAGDRFGIDRRYADPDDLFADDGVDGVIVATPNTSHHPLAAAALDAGKHVLVEKPMTLTADDAWDLVDRARTGGLHLVVGYTYQFTRHARFVRDVVRSGRLGDLQLVTGVFASAVQPFLRGRPDEFGAVFEFSVTGPRPETYADPAIAGGGQGHTQLTHTMGMVAWATGLRPVQVHAMQEHWGLRVDLADAIAFRCDSGAIGTMAAVGSIQPGMQQRHELRYVGSRGMLVQDLNGRHVELHLADGTSEVPPDLGEDELYPTEAPARNLADLILGTDTNRAPGEDAAVAVEFLEAVYRSAELGVPVDITPRSGSDGPAAAVAPSPMHRAPDGDA